MEKQKVTVFVAGREYTLVSSEPESHLERVAAYADRALRETAAASRLPVQQSCVLTVINLADDLLKAQDEITILRRELRAWKEKAD